MGAQLGSLWVLLPTTTQGIVSPGLLSSRTTTLPPRAAVASEPAPWEVAGYYPLSLALAKQVLPAPKRSQGIFELLLQSV